VFLVFFCFAWLGHWWVSWCVVGCLSVVVWFYWGYYYSFSLLIVVDVMFARNIGGDRFDGSLVVLVCGASWWC